VGQFLTGDPGQFYIGANIAIARLRLDLRNQAFVAKRIVASNSKQQAIRSLKRDIARGVFGIIMRRQKPIN
jgi:transposase